MIPIKYKALPSEKVLVVATDTGKRMVLNCLIDQFQAGLENYNKGAFMQDAFHFLTPNEGEFLISGTTPEEWKQMFPDSE